MTWFDSSRGCNPLFAVEDYNELKKELKSKVTDFEKLDFLKYQHKEFIKTLFYQSDTKLEKKHPKGSFGLASQIEKEMLTEIDYLEFKIKTEKTKKQILTSNRKGTKGITDNDRIEQYIKTAIKLNDIPKGEKYLDKTLYRKLNNKTFLFRLLTAVREKSGSNYKYPIETIELLKELENHLFLKINSAGGKEQRTKKQVKTEEYIDDIEYK